MSSDSDSGVDDFFDSKARGYEYVSEVWCAKPPRKPRAVKTRGPSRAELEERERARKETESKILQMERELDAMVLAIDKRSKELSRARDKELGAMAREKNRLVEKLSQARWAAMCPNAGKPLR